MYFQMEMKVLNVCNHPNIITLLGICDEEDEKTILYEFMPNGSLYDYLYTHKVRIPRMTMEQRLETCIGVAKALACLHSGTNGYHFIHGDLNPKNILLDVSLVPKITGFKLSRTSDADLSFSPFHYRRHGMEGYNAPECYEANYNPSQKVDVYAFGIVLLEVLCEKPAWKHLVVQAFPFIIRGELPNFSPLSEEKNLSPKCARACANLIRDCLENDPDRRPSINQVVDKLELALKLQKHYQPSGLFIGSKSFSFAEIETATNNFSNKLGKGGQAEVFHGNISEKGNNVFVAVKRMNINHEEAGILAFEIERKLLSACDHVNIISLVGYCDAENETILVYEFMPNGSLHDQIYNHHDPTPRMNIEQRLQICIGVANGLHFLHSRDDYKIIHSDLKTENILLDAKFVPKISDFGMSRTHVASQSTLKEVTYTVGGTEGYMAPECYDPHRVSRKADVYAFGVVLLEVLCEKQPWKKLVICAQPSLLKGELPEFVPEHVRRNISSECLGACVNIIKACLDINEDNRPSMSQVIANLEFALTLQRKNQDGNRQKSQSQAISQQIFSIEYIQKITNGFAHQISDKGLGKVYHGNINVAVKRMNVAKEEDIKYFQKEVDLLSACHHANVISLLGYCDEPDEKILAFEFTQNGSLYDCLHCHQSRTTSFTVEQRLEICFGVAKGLSYIHYGTRFSIIHCNLNTDNILLDHNFVAKISGFELSTKYVPQRSASQEYLSQIQGNNGYVAPECYQDDYKVNQKADVYAFGVIFLEVLCERPAKNDLVKKAFPFISRGELLSITPEHVKTCISQECAQACESVIRDCLQNDPEKRPFMNVVNKLESALNVQKQRAHY